MEPEICMKMLRNLSEKLTAKFPVTTLCYSMVASKNVVKRGARGRKAFGHTS